MSRPALGAETGMYAPPSPDVSLMIYAPPYEPLPPGEPSPWLYTVGPLGLFYWQWIAVAVAGVFVFGGNGTRRRR